MIPVYVDRVVDFKKCCLITNNYDGIERHDYFRE